MTVSILIVNYKTIKELDNCIESIYKSCNSNSKITYEILVLGNDLDKNSKNKITNRFFGVKYFIPTKNLGYGRGNNFLAERAKGEYLLIVNPDTIFKNNISDLLVKFIKKNKKIGAVSPLVLKKNNFPYVPQFSRILTPFNYLFSSSVLNKIFSFNPISRKYWMLEKKLDKPSEVGVINGACFMIKRKIFEETGGFDENFFLYFEDTDLSKRLVDKGYKNYFFPEAKIIHELGSSAKKNTMSKEYFLNSRFYYFKKHFGLFNAIITELFLRINKYIVLLGIITLLGGFLRLYNLSSLMVFIGDQGWFYWSAKQMLIDHQIPLVGIASSHPWIHQGAIWTYVLSIIFIIVKFDPYAPAYFVAMLGTLTILLIYFVSKEMFSKKVALISSFIFATSPLVIHDSRLAYHTSPIPTITLFFIYSVYRLVKGNKTFFPISVFLAGILYNFEIATSSLIATFGLIFIFGLIRKKNWAVSVINDKKIIFYSVVGFLIPMTPMILYDINHGFPQTLKFIIWIFYRIAIFFGYPPLHGNAVGETWNTFINYNLEIIKHMIFIPSATLSVTILMVTIFVFIFSKYKSWFIKRKFIVEDIVLFTFIIFPTLAFLSMKTNSGAYLLMLFPQWIILIAFSINVLISSRIKSFIYGILLILIGILNIYILFRENYFAHRTINDQFEAVKTIIKESNGSKFNILGKGVNSQYESFVTPYKYLLWYLGHPASEKNEKLKFYVSELPDKIKIEVGN